MQALATPDMAKAWLDTVAKHALTGLVAYVVAAVQFGRKLERHGEKTKKAIEDQGAAIMGRIDELEADQGKLASEVWGPQGKSGLSDKVERLQADLAQMALLLREILTTVRLIAPKTGGNT